MSATAVAVPGTVIPTGALVSPGGGGGIGGPQGIQGIQGLSSFNLTTAAFTVPAVNATATVTLVDASWAEVGAYVYVAASDGSGGAAAFLITAINGNQLTLQNPPSPGTMPLASPSSAGLLGALSGNATDYVGGDNACHPRALATTSAAGLLAKLSGNTTDFVDGTNAFQNLASAVAAALFTTWTAVTLTLTPGAGAITTQSCAAYYLKIGKLCILHFQVTVPNIGTASGNSTLSGLPFSTARLLTTCFRETSVNGLLYAWTIGSGATSGLIVGQGNANPAWTNNISYGGSVAYQTT